MWSTFLHSFCLFSAIFGTTFGYEMCGSPEPNVTISDSSTWRCGLYVRNSQGNKMKHVHTMRKLPGRNSDATCSNGKLTNDADWQKFSEKCHKFMKQGLDGDFRLDKPLPAQADGRQTEQNSNRTIGDKLCDSVIQKHTCNNQYIICLSACGQHFMETGFKGPEPICCAQTGKSEFRNVPCAGWRPFLPGRPIPDQCKGIVKK